jgi:hypothetical protein
MGGLLFLTVCYIALLTITVYLYLSCIVLQTFLQKASHTGYFSSLVLTTIHLKNTRETGTDLAGYRNQPFSLFEGTVAIFLV